MFEQTNIDVEAKDTSIDDSILNDRGNYDFENFSFLQRYQYDLLKTITGHVMFEKMICFGKTQYFLLLL